VNKPVILLLGLVLALRGAAAAAVVTSPSDAAFTVVASAFIGSDGTIMAQDDSWVSSVFVASDGLYELTLNSATFTKPPNCVANVRSVEGSRFRQRGELRRFEFPVRGDLEVGKPDPRRL
jgi:hypothetical protein